LTRIERRETCITSKLETMRFRHRLALAWMTAVLCGSTIACTPSAVEPRRGVRSTTPTAAVPRPVDPRCSVQGITATWPFLLHAQVFDHQTGAAPIARFAGGTVEVRIHAIPVAYGARARVVVLSDPSAPGLQVEGWLVADHLIRAKRDLPVVPGHLWVAKEAPLRLTASDSGVPGRARVSPREATFEGLTAEVMCANLTVDAGPTERWSPPATSQRALVTLPTRLLSADGSSLGFTLALAPRVDGARAVVELASTGTRGDLVRVVFEGLDAWVRRDAVTFLDAPRDSDFGDYPDATDEWPSWYDRRASALREATAQSAPSASAATIGTFHQGAALLVSAPGPTGWLRAWPESGTVLPSDGREFWVRQSDVSDPPPN
jgi:hypothetical protein